MIVFSNGLTLETHTVFPKIKFGDAFRVETRWDIVPIEGKKRCSVVVTAGVNFLKVISVHPLARSLTAAPSHSTSNK